MCEANQQNFFIVKKCRMMLFNHKSRATADDEEVSP